MQFKMLRDYLKAVEDGTERVDRLTAALEELIYQPSLGSWPTWG